MNFPLCSLSDAHGMRAAAALYSLNFAATGNTSTVSTCPCLWERIQGQADQWTLAFKQSEAELVCSTDSASGRDVNPVLGLRSSSLSVRAGHAAHGSGPAPVSLAREALKGLIHAIPEFREGPGRAEQREFQDVNSLFSSDWPRTNAGYSKLSLSA